MIKIRKSFFYFFHNKLWHCDSTITNCTFDCEFGFFFLIKLKRINWFLFSKNSADFSMNSLFKRVLWTWWKEAEAKIELTYICFFKNYFLNQTIEKISSSFLNLMLQQFLNLLLSFSLIFYLICFIFHFRYNNMWDIVRDHYSLDILFHAIYYFSNELNEVNLNILYFCCEKHSVCSVYTHIYFRLLQ